MKIEIVSIDGMSLAAEAWRLSRDVDKPIQWWDIYTVDSPCCEMPSAFCHFRDFTILEREIFASSRTHVMWARTSFVDSPEKYRVPKSLLDHTDALTHAQYRSLMREGKERGEHQDRWRRFLPVSAETCFTMRLSYRDAIKYSKYFDWLSGCVAPCLRERFARVAEELTSLVDQFTGSRDMSHEARATMRLAQFLHDGEVPLHAKISCGGVTVAAFEVPFWVRAHFVRHRPITMVDDLLAILRRDDVLDLPISYPMRLQVAASDAIWSQLLGSRACWLTQSTLGSKEYDPWAAIVDQFGGAVLPCSGGTCPHHRDARNRLEGSDPGVPCPRYIGLNDVDPSPHVERIEHAVESRGDYWKGVVQEMREMMEERA